MRTLLLCTVLLASVGASADDRPFARENRFAFSFDFDMSGVSMPGFDGYARDLNAEIEKQANVSGYNDPGSVLGAELLLRYYAPYYIAAEIGAGSVVAHQEYKASAGFGSSTVEYWNMVLELPILLGGHYPVHPRIQLYGLLGPTVLLIPASYWDTSGSAPDFKGKTGVGFQARLGADFYAVEQLAFGFSLVYRSESADVTEKHGNVVPVNGKMVEGYEVDFSGFGFTVGFRLVL